MRHERNDRWDVRFFKRHRGDDPNEACPGEEFLAACPGKVSRTLLAILRTDNGAYRCIPPRRFGELG